MNEMITSVSTVLSIHSNINQNVTISTIVRYFSLVSNQLEQRDVRFPTHLNSSNQTIRIRVKISSTVNQTKEVFVPRKFFNQRL